MLGVLRADVPDYGLGSMNHRSSLNPFVKTWPMVGIRAKFRAKLGNIRIPVQVDVGFGDAVVPGPKTREFPSLLTGLPGTIHADLSGLHRGRRKV